jgi:hypothetical protein
LLGVRFGFDCDWGAAFSVLESHLDYAGLWTQVQARPLCTGVQVINPEAHITPLSNIFRLTAPPFCVRGTRQRVRWEVGCHLQIRVTTTHEEATNEKPQGPCTALLQQYPFLKWHLCRGKFDFGFLVLFFYSRAFTSQFRSTAPGRHPAAPLPVLGLKKYGTPTPLPPPPPLLLATAATACWKAACASGDLLNDDGV